MRSSCSWCVKEACLQAINQTSVQRVLKKLASEAEFLEMMAAWIDEADTQGRVSFLRSLLQALRRMDLKPQSSSSTPLPAAFAGLLKHRQGLRRAARVHQETFGRVGSAWRAQGATDVRLSELSDRGGSHTGLSVCKQFSWRVQVSTNCAVRAAAAGAPGAAGSFPTEGTRCESKVSSAVHPAWLLRLMMLGLFEVATAAHPRSGWTANRFVPACVGAAKPLSQEPSNASIAASQPASLSRCDGNVVQNSRWRPVFGVTLLQIHGLAFATSAVVQQQDGTARHPKAI